jgi:hypothetical protein
MTVIGYTYHTKYRNKKPAGYFDMNYEEDTEKILTMETN